MLAICLLLGSGAAPTPPAAPVEAEAAGIPLDFSFTDMSGAPHALAEARGHLVLLEFWASWCLPCREGFPFLDALQDRHAGEGLKVIAVSLESDDEAVRRFVAEHPARVLVGRDPTGRGGELFEVAAMPTAFLVGLDGRILARFEGGTETVHGQIEAAVRQVLSQPGSAVRSVTQTAGRAPAAGSSLRAWERGYLADPIMSLDGDALTRSMREHVHASKEAASGDGGVSGGGCGCN